MNKDNLSSAEALSKLKRGNQNYLEAKTNSGNISPEIRRQTFEEGQAPYAVVITCSDTGKYFYGRHWRAFCHPCGRKRY